MKSVLQYLPLSIGLVAVDHRLGINREDGSEKGDDRPLFLIYLNLLSWHSGIHQRAKPFFNIAFKRR